MSGQHPYPYGGGGPGGFPNGYPSSFPPPGPNRYPNPTPPRQYPAPSTYPVASASTHSNQVHNSTRSNCPDLTDHIWSITEMAVATGGMADVYHGKFRDPQRGNVLLALKVLRGAHLDDQAVTGERRFKRELAIWHRLNHENVLPFFGTCDGVAGRKALVSPWMQNGNIIEYIRFNHGADIRALIEHVIAGLEYLHSKNVVHGDIKGNNVLIDDSGRALLSDFGRALIVDEIEASRSLSAAAHWTAPEVLTTEGDIPLSYQSDVWSLGITMFELYVGMARLWGGVKRPANVILKINRQEYPAVGGKNMYSEVPPYLWQILDRCWRYDPSRRPSSGQILVEYRRQIGY